MAESSNDEVKVLVRHSSQGPAAPVHTSPLWRSCCVEIDPRAVMYFSQLAISAVVLAVCIYILLTREDCGSQQFAASTLSFVLGVYLPSPKMGPAR